MTHIIFPLAETYVHYLHDHASSFRERHDAYRAGFHWTERHLQCLWFDDRYRPTAFPLPGGETVTVLDPGEWNLEAGPDFLNATLLIQPGMRQLRGDVEIHVHPSDWDAHKHSEDPSYAHVIAHVTWFSGPAPRTLPQGICPLSLAEPILANRSLSLDDIDLKAYPHAVLPATARPCEAALKNAPDRARAVLAAAGHYRLRAKAARIRARLGQTGDRHQIFYEEVMAALGYKRNQAPFRLLARLLPVSSFGPVRDLTFARMLGTARLLPQPESAPDEEGRHTIRTLWDLWWHHSGETLPESVVWRFHNLRPQNSPVRRLAAAACLFSGRSTVRQDLDRLAGESGLRWHALSTDCFESRCRWPFWNKRLAFSSEPDTEREIALLGKSRTAAIITNVVLPFAAAEDALPDGVLNHLPPEDLSAPMRLTARHLFGRDHNPSLYADSGLLQQGLLQIHLDFCLNAKPGCDDCALYAALADHAS